MAFFNNCVPTRRQISAKKLQGINFAAKQAFDYENNTNSEFGTRN